MNKTQKHRTIETQDHRNIETHEHMTCRASLNRGKIKYKSKY